MDPAEGMQVIPRSSTGQWIAKLSENRQELARLENIFINKIPYAVLKTVMDSIQERWTEWQQYAQVMSTKSVKSSKEFMGILSSPESTVRLQQLIKAARTLNDVAVRNCFVHCKNLEKERQLADGDLSNGYMKDIDPEAIKDVAQFINDNPQDWRLIGDGLGFDNLACQKLESPLKMIRQWMQQHEAATVRRLQFEAAQLKMNSVCSYLDAIPLEGASKIVLPPISWVDTLQRNVTVYDIDKIKEICESLQCGILWDVVAKNLCPYEVKNNNHTDVGRNDPSEVIWRASSVNLVKLLALLENETSLKPVAQKFKSDYNDGIYESTSPGGVSYSQINYLCQAIQQLRELGKNDNPINQMWGGSINHMIDMYDLVKNLPYLNIGHSLELREFLFLYWQLPFNKHSDLHQLTMKYVEIFTKLKGRRASDFAELLYKKYLEIKPYRTYDPVLAVQKLQTEEKKPEAKEAEPRAIPCEKLVSLPAPKESAAGAAERPELKETVAKVKAVSMEKVVSLEKPKEPENDGNCVVCFEREINAVIIPCGHLACCMQCVKDMAACPMCRGPITSKVQIFKAV